MSDWYQIENNSFIIQVTSLGAEMKRLFSKDWHRELLWLGDEKTWKRSAPVLFPIVGGLKDGKYTYQSKDYKMPQHGFARDTEFKCTECGTTEVSFLLEANQTTFNDYPFCFNLRVQYKLDADKLSISYYVKNDDRQDIYFSIGAHPAFETKTISDYEIKFQKLEAEYFQLQQGLVNWAKPIRFNESSIKPTSELFQNDALIFKKLKSKYLDYLLLFSFFMEPILVQNLGLGLVFLRKSSKETAKISFEQLE